MENKLTPFNDIIDMAISGTNQAAMNKMFGTKPLMAEDSDMKGSTVLFPKELHAKLKILSAVTDVDMRDLIVDAVETLVKKYGGDSGDIETIRAAYIKANK